MRLSALLLLALPVAALAQTPPPAHTSAKSIDPLDKVTCKSFTEIGSLIASKKECKTRRQWDIERDEAQHRLHECADTPGASC